MNILLTGATGFVGSHILKGLLEDSHSMYIVKRSFSDTSRINNLLERCVALNLDEISIEEIYEKYDIECVVHCATYYGRADSDYMKNVNTNLLFPLELLCHGLDRNLKYFINTDTFFGNQIETEQDLDKELYMYGYTLSKIQFRQWGRMFAGKYGMKFINMKLQHVFGKNDAPDKFIPFVVKSFVDNIPALELSAGEQRRDFICISDVVNAYRIVIDKLKDNEDSPYYMEYDVGTGRARSLREFVELIAEGIGSATELKWGKVAIKKGELMFSKADNHKLLELGWKPKITDEKDIVKMFRDNYGAGGVMF